MSKNYRDFSKEEKKQIRVEFYKTDFGKINKPRMTRLLIISLLLLIYSIYLFLDTLLNDGNIWGYVSMILILVFSIVFFIGRQKIFYRDLNNYLKKRK